MNISTMRMSMHSTTVSSDPEVTRAEFVLGDATGAIWHARPVGPLPRPLVLLGHGGGQHHGHPSVVARARRCVAAGFAAACLDAPGHGDRPRTEEDLGFVAELRHRMQRGEPMGSLIARQNNAVARRSVPEWRALLDALPESGVVAPDAPIGYWGLSMAGAIGIVLAAEDPRIVAAVLGLVGHPDLLVAAARVTASLQFVVQWDDEHVDRGDALALFDNFASPEKSLHANPGGHGDVPAFERESAEWFLRRHLLTGAARADAASAPQARA